MSIYSLDFYVLLSLRDFEFTQTHTGNRGTADDPRREIGGKIHLLVSLFIYLAGVILAVVHRQTVGSFLRANVHFIAALALVGVSAFTSPNGAEVARSVVQLSIGLIIAITYAATHVRGPYRSLAVVVFIPLFLTHLGSVVLFFVEGLSFTSFFATELRYGGLAGHPNSLGGQCVLGIWAALVLVTDKESPRNWRIGGGVGAVVFAFTATITGSATALVATVTVASVTLALRLLSVLDVRFRTPAILGFFLVSFVLGGGLFIHKGAEEILGGLTESVGKDSTLTGRTELWEIGISAASERPILGWGLDNQARVKDTREYHIQYAHYHNGFIDTWVASGGLVVLLLLYQMWRFVVMSMKSVMVEPGRSILMPTLVILIILNLSEYSMLRPLSGIYQLYLCAWALLWFSLFAPETGRIRAGTSRNARGSSRRSDRRMSW